MRFRETFEWFSEFCGVCLGCGLLWCHLRIVMLEDRIHWLETIEPKQAIQNNNQQVFVEDPRNELIREIATQNGWKPDANRTNDPAKQPTSKPAAGPAKQSEPGTLSGITGGTGANTK